MHAYMQSTLVSVFLNNKKMWKKNLSYISLYLSSMIVKEINLFPAFFLSLFNQENQAALSITFDIVLWVDWTCALALLHTGNTVLKIGTTKEVMTA